jgi:hypothetical protein
MKRIESNLLCPSCHDPLRPAVLACDRCGINVEGPFQLNEFAALEPDDLHFLRIFVQAEGRIRDMEAALGLSYPTIRTRLTALRTKLAHAASSSAPGANPEPGAAGNPRPLDEARPTPGSEAQRVLEQLETGSLTYNEALTQIRRLRSNP